MKIQVLDHGYVRFIESWGTGKDGQMFDKDGEAYRRDCEVGIVEAARQSTQGRFRSWAEDQRLLEYLYSHNHATPFEFAGMVIEVQAPIFVFREWHRHRTQSYNEMSARYAPLPDLYYQPDVEHVFDRALRAHVEKNKQGASVAEPDRQGIVDWVAEDERLMWVLEAHYKRGLSIGVPKELARKKMPVDHYSRMRAHANLRNWLAFLTLRMDPAAQFEIRMYANAVAELVRHTFPITWAQFARERSHG